MCHFISWIRHADGYYFLTDDEMKTEEGKKLKKFLQECYWTDIVGHGAISEFFHLMRYEGIHEECTSLTNPTYLPISIVEAVKAGKFRSIGRPEKASDLLTDESAFLYEGEVKAILSEEVYKENMAYDKSEEIRNKTWKEYDKVVGYAEDVHTTRYAEFTIAQASEKVDPELLDSMEKTLNKVYNHYVKIRKRADRKRFKETQEGWNEYNATHAELHMESKQKIMNLFWDTFADINNRQSLWR